MNCPKCQTPIADHPANACLDALFAEKVMGWESKKQSGWLMGTYSRLDCWIDKKGLIQYWAHEWYPSANIAWAMEGWDKLKKAGNINDFAKAVGYLSVSIHGEGEYCENINATYLMFHLSALHLTRALVLWAMEKG